MIRSLRSKMFLNFVVLMALVLIAVVFLTQKSFEAETAQLNRQLLRKTVKTTVHIIEQKYDELIAAELDSVVERRMLMENMTAGVLSALESDHDLFMEGALSEGAAKEKALGWLNSIRYGEGQYFFACTMEAVGLSHPLSEMVGRKWLGFQDLKQREALPFICDVVRTRGRAYTVFQWPSSSQSHLSKQMGYFAHFPQWGWVIGTSVAIEDLERHSRAKMDLLIRELEAILPGLKATEEEDIYVFDSEGKFVIHPKGGKQDLDTAAAMGSRALLQPLMTASGNPEIPLRHPAFWRADVESSFLTYVEAYPALHWYIAASLPEVFISVPVRTLVVREFYAIIGIFGIAFLIAVVLSNRLTRRISLLAHHVRELAWTGLGTGLPVSNGRPEEEPEGMESSDEVDYLTHSFHVMERKLKESAEALMREATVNRAFAGLSKALMEALNSLDMAPMVLEHCMELTGSNFGLVGEPRFPVGEFLCRVREGQENVSFRLPAGAIVDSPVEHWGWIVSERVPCLRNASSCHPGLIPFPTGNVIERCLFVPVFIDTGPTGQVFLANSSRDYTEQDVQLVQRLLSLYILALQRKETLELLEERVAQRTSEFMRLNEDLQKEILERKEMEGVLQEARKAAEAGSRAKSEFLATMSHEIRTPMNAIIGMSTLLLDGNLTNEERKFAGIIRRSSEGLLTVLNDILDFSKIEAGKLSMDHQPFDLQGCVDSAIQVVASSCREKGIDLVRVMDASLPAFILGDLGRLRQILINLLDNAVKFTHEGRIFVRVSALEKSGQAEGDERDRPARLSRWERGNACEEGKEVLLRFSVHDTGIGIPDDRVGLLFQPFTQADNSITRKYGGTGLGLAICKRLCRLMGGEIWMESRVGVGSSFYFSITAEVAPMSPVIQQAQERRLVEFANPTDTQDEAFLEDPEDSDFDPGMGKRHPLKILLVEDTFISRELALIMLSRLGYLADVAVNGKEAMERLRGQSYDLVLMDVQMPEMDGLDASRLIRSEFPKESQPFIIAMTAHAMEGDREECLAAGMDEYISKPIAVRELVDKLVKAHWKACRNLEE